MVIMECMSNTLAGQWILIQVPNVNVLTVCELEAYIVNRLIA